MIFGDVGSLKLPDICITGQEKPRKNLTQETCPDRGSNTGPLRDRRTCYHLVHSGGRWYFWWSDLLPAESREHSGNECHEVVPSSLGSNHNRSSRSATICATCARSLFCKMMRGFCKKYCRFLRNAGLRICSKMTEILCIKNLSFGMVCVRMTPSSSFTRINVNLTFVGVWRTFVLLMTSNEATHWIGPSV